MQNVTKFTSEHCDIVNNAIKTHDYSDEAVASYEATGDDMMEALQERFEALITYSEAIDLGGVCAYFTDDKLTAFYDYENFTGSNALYAVA